MVTADKKVKQIVRWGEITEESSETKKNNAQKDIPIKEVLYAGKTGNSVVWFPYGYNANLPEGTRGVLLNSGSEPTNRVFLGGSPNQRILVETNEVVIYHPESGSKIHFKANGDIEIDTDTDLNITAKNINVAATNKVNVTATNEVDITAPNVNITGDTTITIDGGTLVDLIAAEVKASNGGAVQKLCNKTFFDTFNDHRHSGDLTPVFGSDKAVIDIDTTTVLKGE